MTVPITVNSPSPPAVNAGTKKQRKDRLEDLKRAAADRDYQMQLMIELLPEES
ncbi:MAG: hypothetical protein NC430_14120 [bacterium]|nr:hypothetical protein [bacterium]MCM1422425.1 hypothetical protein [bacterium]